MVLEDREVMAHRYRLAARLMATAQELMEVALELDPHLAGVVKDKGNGES